MGRPRKFADSPLDSDLRISVTQAQKRLIQEAVGLDNMDMAAWARHLLIQAAEARIARNNRDIQNRKTGLGD